MKLEVAFPEVTCLFLLWLKGQCVTFVVTIIDSLCLCYLGGRTYVLGNKSAYGLFFWPFLAKEGTLLYYCCFGRRWSALAPLGMYCSCFCATVRACTSDWKLGEKSCKVCRRRLTMAGQTECTIRTFRSGEENMKTRNGELMVAYTYCKILWNVRLLLGGKSFTRFRLREARKVVNVHLF